MMTPSYKDADGTPLCSRCFTKAPSKSVGLGWKCQDCIRTIKRERNIYHQFMALNEATTYHELARCSSYYYKTPTNNKPEKHLRQQLELLYEHEMNIIINEICNQYCLKYNDMYDINLIKPLWYMIFDFASEERDDILLFVDYSNYLKNDQNLIIKNALLTLIEVAYQLADCEKIPSETTRATITNENENENKNSNPAIGETCDDNYNTYLQSYYDGSWDISVNVVETNLKTIENMINVIKMKDRRWIGAWNNGPYMYIHKIKLESKDIVKMVKTCKFFKEYQFKPNKYYKIFINLIVNSFGANNLNDNAYIFQFEEEYRMYHYFVVAVPHTDITYGIYVRKRKN